MVNYNDTRTALYKPLPSAEDIQGQFAANPPAMQFVKESRDALRNIIQGHDDRLAVIVGPCSLHDLMAAREYAERLKEQQLRLGEDLFLVMRSYFEKPRTCHGWKGFINDPHRDGSCDILSGLQGARQFLLDLACLNVPAGGEFLSSITQRPLQDLMSWYAIGARTTESQLHREIASGLPMVTGFKNTREGNIQAAINAVKVAGKPHVFCDVDFSGRPAIVSTQGNRFCHIILRGGGQGPNYDDNSRHQAEKLLRESELRPTVMVDCSHDNSPAHYRHQIEVADHLGQRLAFGEKNICGIMLESHLVAGHQALGSAPLHYGQSITDACLSWDETRPVLEQLARCVNRRRALNRRSA